MNDLLKFVYILHSRGVAVINLCKENVVFLPTFNAYVPMDFSLS